MFTVSCLITASFYCLFLQSFFFFIKVSSFVLNNEISDCLHRLAKIVTYLCIVLICSFLNTFFDYFQNDFNVVIPSIHKRSFQLGMLPSGFCCVSYSEMLRILNTLYHLWYQFSACLFIVELSQKCYFCLFQ